ncbi:MAG: AAA family ATPase [Selenomonadales bacterium]|nr:AAA family ATPase [Selenomonadales bacterium]
MKRPELLIGLSLAALVFLVYANPDTLPYVVLTLLAGAVWYKARHTGAARHTGQVVSTEVYSLSFEDIGGQNTAKQELKEALDFIRSEHAAAALGIRPLKGILLCGPPGTGKTLLAKAAASYTDAAFLATSGSEFIEMYAGVGAQRVRELFRKAEQLSKKQGKSRAIVFIDEIDVLGAKRGKNTSHMEYDQTLNQLLVEMDGLKTSAETGVLLIGATNRADLLDPALTRPGRFDRIVRVDLPDRAARKSILELHTRTKPLAEEVDLEQLAAETAGFSGAHLESLSNEAAILAWRRGQTEVTQRDFTESIDKVVLGEQHDRRPSKEELRRIAFHELGHAFAAETRRAGSVGKLSILSRGGALGYVRQQPEQDNYLETEESLRDQLVVALAGGVAEELFLGSRSTGTEGDYKQATAVALRMVAAGMSALGLVDERLVPKVRLHAAVQVLLKRAEQQARAVLTEHEAAILRLSEVLLTEEKMSGEQFRALLRAS